MTASASDGGGGGGGRGGSGKLIGDVLGKPLVDAGTCATPLANSSDNGSTKTLAWGVCTPSLALVGVTDGACAGEGDCDTDAPRDSAGLVVGHLFLLLRCGDPAPPGCAFTRACTLPPTSRGLARGEGVVGEGESNDSDPRKLCRADKASAATITAGPSRTSR